MKFLTQQEGSMQVNIKDKAYLWDITQACSDIISFTEKLTFKEFSEIK